jgi:23S rRNA pseudouridine1911/1915/1917 synthase
MNDPVVIYEDKNFLIVNKPVGLLVHPTNSSSEPTLVSWLLPRYPELKEVGDEPGLRPGIVHRLDKETSGVMIVPRNQEWFAYLKSLFAARLIKKKYIAVVFGKPSSDKGTIEIPIGIKAGTIRRSVRSSKMAKSAKTTYKVIKSFDSKEPWGNQKYSVLEVFPETGRTHQIRVHLASIGHAVLGDPLYGPRRKPEWVNRLMLHAESLEFADLSGSAQQFSIAPDFVLPS